MDEATKKPKLSFSGVQPINPTANPASLTGYLSMSMQVAQKNAVEAELAPAPSMDKLNFDQQQALTRGYLKHFVNKLDKSNPDTATILKGVDGALRSQDFNALGQFFPELVPSLSIYQNNPKALGNYVDFAKEYLGGQIKVVESVSTLAKAEADAAVAADIQKANANTADFATSVYNTASSIQATGSYARDVRFAVADLRSQAVAETNPDVITSLNDRAKVIETSLVDGLVTQLVRGKTPDDVTRIRQAVADNNYANLTDDERTNFFILMDGISPDMRDHVDTELGAYAAGPAKFAETKQREEAVASVNSLRSELFAFRSLGSTDQIQSAVTETVGAIESIPGLPDGDAKSVKDQAYIEAANAALNLATRSAGSAEDLTQMQSYIQSGEAGNLSPQVLRSLDTFVELGGLVTDNGFRQSAFNNAEKLRNDQLTEAQNARTRMDAVSNVSDGFADPGSKDGQTAADNFLVDVVNRTRANVGGVPLTALPADLWRNPTYMQDPQYVRAFEEVYKTPNAMPTGLLSSLKSLAAGNYNPTIMAHYNAMKNISSPQGITANPALKALEPDEIMLLEHYNEIIQVAGSETNIAPMVAAAKQNMSKEGFPKTVEMFLGLEGNEKINDWMMKSVDDYSLLNTSQKEAVKSLVTYLVADTLAGSPVQQTPKSIAKRINDQIDTWFPSGNGYVIDMSNGLPSSRTQAALSRTVPKHQSKFLSFVQAELRLEAPDIDVKYFQPEAQTIAELGGERIKPYLQLVPRGTDRFGGETYMVVRVDPQTGGFPQPINRKDGSPLMVSTREPKFKLTTDLDEALEKVRNQREEAAAKELLDLTSGKTPITLGGN
jgi:hypothetical protein